MSTGEQLIRAVQTKMSAMADGAGLAMIGLRTAHMSWGPGGCGKTWIIEAEARRRGVFLQRLGSVSAKALFAHLRRYREDVTLIEDNEQLFRNPDALTVLREALWTVDREELIREDGRFPDRVVRWARDGRGQEEREFVFSGAIIITQNASPPNTPAVNALMQRIRPYYLDLSPTEIEAFARHLAATAPPRIGGKQMTAEMCVEVLDTMKAISGEQITDMRLVRDAYTYYVAGELLGEMRSHWTDHVRILLSGRVHRRFSGPADPTGPTGPPRLAEREAIVGELYATVADSKERERLAFERIGISRATFYRIARELGLTEQ